MKHRLLLLYKLHRIDRELLELYSLRGDIPQKIEELKTQKSDLEHKFTSMQEQLEEINKIEEQVQQENDTLLERIERNDEILRSGSVKSNKEYDALAKEIEEANIKIRENERAVRDEYSGKKQDLAFQIGGFKVQINEVNEELEMNVSELENSPDKPRKKKPI
jgi:predicted  nucleic acid-binding Zn-ribbon protein